MRANNRKETGKSSWMGIVVLLLFTAPELAIPLVIFGSILWVVIQSVKKSQQTSGSRRQETFDDCPRGFFCRHRDKGEHHLKRGREMDPWDRPDIDISKYQRRNGKDGA